ncbi:MAG: Smr/MutS family protein, partial [Bacteroidetes bacterium]|nr:Smr/MutS family protein [Bacteroidota bacterium]
KLFTEKKPKTYIDQLPREKNPAPAPKHAPGVWLMFLPKFEADEFGDDVVDSLKIYLVNGNGTGYRFDYKLNYFGEPGFELKNELLANKDFYLHDIPFSNLNDSPSFSCEFSLITPEKTKAEYYETSLKIKPQQLFKRIEELKQKGETTISYKLFDTYPDRVEEDKPDYTKLSKAGFKVYEASKARQHLPPARSVVDLHADKLADNWEKMSPFEIVTMQMSEFEKYYDLAVAHKLPSMFFIHGVGSGRLRDEIHERLRVKRNVKSFVNQYHPAYGYGATEVYFQY